MCGIFSFSKMTSRRSRLKAVANLPVRRKPLTSEETSDDIKPSDNTVFDKLASVNLIDTDKAHDNTSEPLSSQEAVTDNDFFKEGKNGSDSVSNGIRNKNISQEICLNDEKEDSDKTCSVSEEKTLKEIKDTHETYILTNNINNIKQVTSDSLKKLQQDGPNLNLSKQKQQLEKNLININNSEKVNSVVEDINNFTCLNSENITVASGDEYSNSTTSTCTIATNNFTGHSVNPDYEEVEVYNELVKPTEIFITSCAFTCGDNNENDHNQFLMDTESSEPTFTTLADFNVSKDIDEVNLNYLRCNMPNESNETHNVFIKPPDKNLVVTSRFNMENEQPSKNSYISLKEKRLKENSITPISQNFTSDPESLNFVKRSISMIKKKRSKCSDFTKKLADARREFQKKYEKTKPDRSTLKMIDLIFYNPSTNPMESKSKLEKKATSFIQEESHQEGLAEEDVDEPEAVNVPSQINSFDGKDIENMNQLPVPQVKIGLNGEIILDEKSLVIETTEGKKGREDLQNSIPIFEDGIPKVSYYRGKTKKTRDWTDLETKRFYKALNTIGPDFSLMQKYFPKRSRLELKNKFKREEKLNRNLIDKALNNPSEFDMTQLEKDLAVEEKAEFELRLNKRTKEKSTLKKPRRKSSHLSREMMELDEEYEHNRSINLTNKIISQNEKNKKKKEISFIFQKIILKESEKQISELSGISSLGVI